MKKSLLALALSFGLVGALNAQDVDVLALVTKGAVSDNSKGVKVLSLDEMKQVKGGMLVSPHSYVYFENQYRQPISYTEYWQITPEPYEEKIGAIKTSNRGYSPSDYVTFKEFTASDPQNQIVAVMSTYNYQTQTIQTDFVILNTKTRVHRYYPLSQLARAILDGTREHIENSVYYDRNLPVRQQLRIIR